MNLVLNCGCCNDEVVKTGIQLYVVVRNVSFQEIAAPITVSPVDKYGQGNAVGSFLRYYAEPLTVRLTAGFGFRYWHGPPGFAADLSDSPTIDVVVPPEGIQIEANYYDFVFNDAPQSCTAGGNNCTADYLEVCNLVTKSVPAGSVSIPGTDVLAANQQAIAVACGLAGDEVTCQKYYGVRAFAQGMASETQDFWKRVVDGSYPEAQRSSDAFMAALAASDPIYQTTDAEWAPDTDYEAGDIVLWSSFPFRARLAVAATATPPTDGSDWEALFRVSLDPPGVWQIPRPALTDLNCGVRYLQEIQTVRFLNVTFKETIDISQDPITSSFEFQETEVGTQFSRTYSVDEETGAVSVAYDTGSEPSNFASVKGALYAGLFWMKLEDDKLQIRLAEKNLLSFAGDIGSYTQVGTSSVYFRMVHIFVEDFVFELQGENSAPP